MWLALYFIFYWCTLYRKAVVFLTQKSAIHFIEKITIEKTSTFREKTIDFCCILDHTKPFRLPLRKRTFHSIKRHSLQITSYTLYSLLTKKGYTLLAISSSWGWDRTSYPEVGRPEVILPDTRQGRSADPRAEYACR